MSQPKNAEEYMARYKANQRVEGYGLDTRMVMPCPFCAAADFATHGIVELEPQLEAGATCRECGRSARIVLTHFGRADLPGGVRRLEAVQACLMQTGGPDQPAWLQPQFPRDTAAGEG